MESHLISLAQKVALPHTTIVVIDMQNDFCSEGGAFAQSGANMTAVYSLIPRLRQFLDRSREKNATIVFIRTARSEEDISPSMRELWARHGPKGHVCVKDSWGAEFIPDIQPRADELVIKKTRYSAFLGTDLDMKLRDMGTTTLVLTGVATNVCVETTARDGFMRNYYIVVLNDLVATYDKNLHDNALLNLDRYFGTVTPSAEILQIWEDEA